MHSEIPLLIRLIWFVVIGVHLGWFSLVLAWLCCITVIGMPLGLWIFSRVPFLMTLKEPTVETHVIVRDGNYYLHHESPDQIPMPIRFVYFLLFGWWVSAIWIAVAFFFSAILIGIPIAFWMFNRVPMVVWLTQP